MSRGTDSLNVATAAALAFYERVRRRVDDAAEDEAEEEDETMNEVQLANLTIVSDDHSTPWGTGLTVVAFVAAVTAGAIVVLSMGMTGFTRWCR